MTDPADWSRLRPTSSPARADTASRPSPPRSPLGLGSQGEAGATYLSRASGHRRMFDVDPLPYAERRIATGLRHDGRQLARSTRCTSILSRRCWVPLMYCRNRPRRPGRWTRFGVIEFGTTIAPASATRNPDRQGVQRRCATAATRARSATTPCSDAPLTGRIARFLNVNDELAGLLARPDPQPGRHRDDAVPVPTQPCTW